MTQENFFSDAPDLAVPETKLEQAPSQELGFFADAPDLPKPVSVLGGKLTGKEDVFIEAGLRHDVDPKLLMAMSMFETGDGTSHMVRTKNNVGGLTEPGNPNIYRTFTSVDDSIETMARTVRRNYLDKGLTTIGQIGAKYAPPGASNDPNQTNAEWPSAVTRNYQRLSTEEIHRRIGEFPTVAGKETKASVEAVGGGDESLGIFADVPEAGGAAKPPPKEGALPEGGGDLGIFADVPTVSQPPVKIEEPPPSQPPPPQQPPPVAEETPAPAPAATPAPTRQLQPLATPPEPTPQAAQTLEASTTALPTPTSPPPGQLPFLTAEQAAQIPSFEQQVVAPPLPPEEVPSYFQAKAGVYPQEAKAMAPVEQPGILRNAYEAAVETGQGFIPTSLDALNKMVEPAINAPAEVRRGYDVVKDFIQGTPIDDIVKQRIPESQLLVEADKTPAFSKERFKAGFQVVSQMAMAAALGSQIKSPVEARVKKQWTKPSIVARAKEQPSSVVQTTNEALARAEAAQLAPTTPTQAAPAGEPTATTAPAEFVTSTKNAVVDAERQARGLSPILDEAVQSNPATMAAAEAKLAANPDYGRALVSDLVAGTKKSIDAVDEAVLLREKIKTQNERALAGERAKDPSLTDTERALATERFQEAENYISEIDLATYRSGQAWGRMGQFRQRLARDDYSLVTMESRMRIAKGNKPLTPDELATLQKQVKDLQKAQQAMQARVEKLTKGGKQLSESQQAKVNRLSQKIEDLKARLDPLHQLRQEVIRRYEELDRRLAREKGLLPPGKPGKPRPKVEDLDIQALQTELNRVKAIKAERAALRRMNEGLDQRIARMKGIAPKIEKKLAGKIEGDLETEALQVELDRLKAMQKEARAAGREQKRLEATKERLERRVAQMKGLEPVQVRTKPSPITDLEVEILRTELARLKEQQREANRLPEAKARAARRIKEIEDRIENYGYARPTPREPVKPDKELRELQYRVATAKEKLNRGLVDARWKSQEKLTRFLKNFFRSSTLPRALVASLDLSYLLRQGKIMLMSRPLTTIRTFGETFKAGFGTRYREALAEARTKPGGPLGVRRPFQIFNAASKRGYEEIQQSIRDDPHYYESKYEGGVSYTDVEPNARLSQMEEVYQSAWAEAIPLVRESQRAYVAFLNKLRLESYKALKVTLGNNGEFTPIQAKIAGNYVNVVTGRGNLKMFGQNAEQAAAAMAQVFFAPRYRVSRFQYISGQPLWHLEHLAEGRTPAAAQMRNVIAGEYARALAGYSVYYSLLYAALSAFGARPSIESDPRSSDFGKIKFGNTRIDPLAGLSQATVFAVRTLLGQTKTEGGEIRPIKGPVPYGKTSWSDVAQKFIRSGMAPIPGTMWDLFNGRDFANQPVTLSSAAVKLITPLSAGDMITSMQEQGFTPGAALSVMSLLGENVQTYSPSLKQAPGGIPMMMPPPPPPPVPPPPPPPPR